MKSSLVLALLPLASCAAVAASPVQDTPDDVRENKFSIYLGQRELDEDDWDPIEDQPVVGVEFSRETLDSVVGWEIGLMGSKEDDEVGGIDVEASLAELYGGVRKTFGEDVLRPYVGAGIALIRAEAEVAGSDDDDGSAAAYAHGGLGIHASEAFMVGVDLRFLLGSDLDLFGSDGDADYVQLAFVLGIGF